MAFKYCYIFFSMVILGKVEVQRPLHTILHFIAVYKISNFYFHGL